MSEEYPAAAPYSRAEQLSFNDEMRMHQFQPVKDATVVYSLPQSAEIHASWHEQLFTRAMCANEAFFGVTPAYLRVALADTTDQYNRLGGRATKVRGDRQYGRYIDRNTGIVALTPEGIIAESNVMSVRKEPVTEVYEKMITHETAHATTEHILADKYRELPYWMLEGIPSLFIDEPAMKATPDRSRRLAEALPRFQSTPMTREFDTELFQTHFPGWEHRSPIVYTYGVAMLEWLSQHEDTTTWGRRLFHSRSKEPKTVAGFLKEFARDNKGFEHVFGRFYGMSPLAAHEAFMKFTNATQ